MKKVLLFVSTLLLVFTIAGCKPEEVVPVTGLTSVTLSGFSDQEFEKGAVVNVFDGVVATGSDGVDYSDSITAASDNCTIASDGVLDTSNGRACIVVYSVVVEGKLDRQTATFTITVPTVIVDENAPLVKGWTFDTEADLVGWAKFEAGGGSVTASIETETLKLEIISGGQPHESRYSFMGVPLVGGEDYVVKFKAKSSVADKKVNLQIGELLPAPTYFEDFKPDQDDIITLTTEWADYSYSFTMPSTNVNGGPLFGMGNIPDSVGIDCTIWIDDLEIRGGSDEDNLDPTITGADDLTIFIGDVTSFVATEGVTAMDYPDTDLTSAIIIGGDTVDVTVADVYVVTYTVTDAASNTKVVNRTVTVLEDTEGPVITGVDAVVLTVGSSFDDLDGVVATDNRDGDVTGDIIVSGDTVDTNVADIYTVTYTVEDALGNITTVDRLVTITAMIWDPADLVLNGDFDELQWYAWFGDQWSGYTDSSASVVEGALNVIVSYDETQTFPTHATQVYQEGFAVENGKFYRISFMAKADAAKDIIVAFGDALDADPWFTNYVAKTTKSLTTEYALYTIEFEMTETTTTDQGKLVFELATAVETTVYIDDVMIEEIDALGGTVVTDTDQVVNGDFALTNTSEWGGWFGDEWIGYTTSSINADDGVLNVVVAGLLDTQPSHATQVYQEGMAFEHGQTYRVTFKAYAEAVRQMNVNIGDALDADPWFIKFMDTAVIDLTTDLQEFEIIFTFTGESTLDQGKLVFELGAIGGVAVNTTVHIDDVNIEVLRQDEVLQNEDFEDIGWTGWFGDQWSGYTDSSIAVVDGALNVVVSYDETQTFPTHATQVYQEGFAVENGKFYRISFMAKADAAKDIIVAFGDALDYDPWFTNYAVKTTKSLTTEYVLYTIEFEMTEPTTTDQGKLVFELATAVETTVYIDNVMVEEIDALGGTVVTDTDQVINGTFEEALEWGAWFGDEYAGYTSSSASVVNGVLEVEVVLNTTTVSHATQVYQEGLAFAQGVTYIVEFDAYADAARQMNVNLGDALEADPWFTGFAPTEVVDLTTSVQTFTYTFTMTEATTADQGKLVFELGMIDGVGVDTTVYIDNVMIYADYN